MCDVSVFREDCIRNLAQTHSLYSEELGYISLVHPKRIVIPAPLDLTQTSISAISHYHNRRRTQAKRLQQTQRQTGMDIGNPGSSLVETEVASGFTRAWGFVRKGAQHKFERNDDSDSDFEPKKEKDSLTIKINSKARKSGRPAIDVKKKKAHSAETASGSMPLLPKEDNWET